MSPFDFVLTLLSFIYALALAHMLVGVARMVRRRRRIVFSWPHALWMAFFFLDLVINWLGLWDVRKLHAIDLLAITTLTALATGNYLVVALVTPEFESETDLDLERFHKEQGRTYLAAWIIFLAMNLITNSLAGVEGLGAWADQNGVVLAAFTPAIAALFLRQRWLQILFPILSIALVVYYVTVFYPKIA